MRTCVSRPAICCSVDRSFCRQSSVEFNAYRWCSLSAYSLLFMMRYIFLFALLLLLFMCSLYSFFLIILLFIFFSVTNLLHILGMLFALASSGCRMDGCEYAAGRLRLRCSESVILTMAGTEQRMERGGNGIKINFGKNAKKSNLSKWRKPLGGGGGDLRWCMLNEVVEDVK